MSHSAEKGLHDRGLSWPTVATVNLMLKQLERDRLTPYWADKSDWLDGAESWLLSLRDWLACDRNHLIRDCPRLTENTPLPPEKSEP